MVTVAKINNLSWSPASLVGKNSGVPTGWACWVIPMSRPPQPPKEVLPGDMHMAMDLGVEGPISVNWTIGAGPYDWGILTKAGMFWISDHDWAIWIEPVDGQRRKLKTVSSAHDSIDLTVEESGQISA